MLYVQAKKTPTAGLCTYSVYVLHTQSQSPELTCDAASRARPLYTQGGDESPACLQARGGCAGARGEGRYLVELWKVDHHLPVAS